MRVLWRLLPSLVVLVGVLNGRLLLLLLRVAATAALRLAHVAVLVSGSGVVWWMLRAYQLSLEQEILDSALLKHRFYKRYRQPTAGFQLKVVKRLPVGTHLRTAWGLAPEVADEIAAFVTLAVRDYVGFWFTPISPNDDFPHDVQFLLADLLGAAVARVVEIDSTLALTMAAKCVELLRLHLGWFREAYAQLAEEHPSVFQGEDSDANLLKRQELVAAYMQTAKFLHPGCVVATTASTTSGTKKPSTGSTGSAAPAETAEVQYLRHIATQLLVQLKPELGQQSSTNLFVSIAMNFLRECLVFKALKPLVEYSQPRYANELVAASLAAEEEQPLSPMSASSTATYANGGTPGLGFNVPLPQLNSPSIDLPNLRTLRLTKSFLYKATKRSSEQAEAALHAVMDAVSAAASTAGGNLSGSPTSPTSMGDVGFENEFWSESSAFGIVSPRSPTGAMPLSPPLLPTCALTPSSERKGGHFASIFSLDDRISFPKTPRIMVPRAPLSGGSAKSIISNPLDGTTHMEDLKTSLNTSLFKVKKTFRNIGGHLQDQSQMAMSSTTQAASLMKTPGKLFQKALRRPDSSMETPVPMSPNDFPSTPPNSLTGSTSQYGKEDSTETSALRSPTETQSPAKSDTAPETPNTKAVHMQDRVLLLLEKTIANYIKLCQERSEMRSSARSRELYELLSALEDVFMLGYRKPGGGVDDERHGEQSAVSGLTLLSSANGADTPPGSPTSQQQRRSDAYTAMLDASQVYWNYLAQDRSETPFLNDHWKFVEASCPVCANSESFYSTRGVQWILVALEKGMLWEYVTALHLNRRLTEQFYESVAVLRNGKLMEKVLKSLFQLNKLHVSLEIPQLLGRQSELETELGIRPAAASAQVVRVVETAWEVERYVPLQGWVKSQDKRTKELPSSEWVWENEWVLETTAAATAAMGARESTVDARSPQVPRRSGSAGSDSSDAESTLWEYGKTMDDRFHDKEKKLDSVRRRKWTRRRRQLPPVLSLPNADAAAFNSGSSPSALSRAARSSNGSGLSLPAVSSPQQGASPRRHASRQGSWDADDIELAGRKKNPAMLTKRRSFSLDKGSDSGEIAAPAPSPQMRLSGVGSVFRRKKRVSLKRSGDSKGRASATGTDLGDEDLADALAALGDVDGDADDDGQLCFRCFKALAGPRPSMGGSGSASTTCQSCHQRVCGACHDFYAFLVYPPPLESSRKEQVCGSCYDRFVARYKLKVDAHVGKYFIRERGDADASGGGGGGGAESDSLGSGGGRDLETRGGGPLSPGGGASGDGDTRSRYEVTVQMRDEASFAWSVVKSFADFVQLEKELYEKLKKQEKKHGAACRSRHWKGVDYSELRAVEPSLRQFPAAAAPYEKKALVLDAFLQRLLQCDTLCQSSVVQKFLLLGEHVAGVGGVASAFAASHFGDVGVDGVASPSGGLSSGAAPSSTNSSSSSSSIGCGVNPMAMVENGKWRRGRWIAPEANSKETKMRVLQKLEVSLFAVLNEVFEFDGIGMLRRHLFSMTRSFIKAFLSASHFRKIERQYLTFTDPKKMTASLAAFREYLFPPQGEAVPPPPAELTALEMQALRKTSLEAVLAQLPSAIVSVVGEASSANAALKLHEFLQHELFLKNLLFSVSDELLPHVFPDAAPYAAPKPKAPTRPK